LRRYPVVYNGATASFALNYADAAVAVTSVSPASGGFTQRHTLTVRGAGFGASVAGAYTRPLLSST
jgi:hypothetical protein